MLRYGSGIIRRKQEGGDCQSINFTPSQPCRRQRTTRCICHIPQGWQLTSLTVLGLTVADDRHAFVVSSRQNLRSPPTAVILSSHLRSDREGPRRSHDCRVRDSTLRGQSYLASWKAAARRSACGPYRGQDLRPRQYPRE